MTLRADISHHSAIKMAFEQTFGNQAWLDLKECTSIASWKKYTTRLLCAMQIAIEETVQVRDDAWFKEICDHIKHGLQITRDANSVEELLSGLSAALIPIVFLQIGMFPKRSGSKKVSLARDNWRLDTFRTVQYVQSDRQLEALFSSNQQKTLGVDKQMGLHEQYRASNSKLPYSNWCEEHGT
jgi:hypothetical protein